MKILAILFSSIFFVSQVAAESSASCAFCFTVKYECDVSQVKNNQERFITFENNKNRPNREFSNPEVPVQKNQVSDIKVNYEFMRSEKDLVAYADNDRTLVPREKNLSLQSFAASYEPTTPLPEPTGFRIVERMEGNSFKVEIRFEGEGDEKSIVISDRPLVMHLSEGANIDDFKNGRGGSLVLPKGQANFLASMLYENFRLPSKSKFIPAIRKYIEDSISKVSELKELEFGSNNPEKYTLSTSLKTEDGLPEIVSLPGGYQFKNFTIQFQLDYVY